MSSIRPLFVVAGVGNGSGTGAASARLFGKLGYRVALISRGPAHLNKLANEINQNDGERSRSRITLQTLSVLHSPLSGPTSPHPPLPSALRCSTPGTASGKPFLEITDEEIRESLDTHVVAAFAFSKEVLLELTKNSLEPADEGGKGGSRKKGTLIFTGATASLRGNTLTSAFAAGKFGIRALSQSLAKEFWKQNIHVAHSIIDGSILTDRSRGLRDNTEWETNTDVRLDPDSIAKSYLHLVEQDNSAWTWEIDLRPAHEKW
ncbi:hypothetical protein BU15DRAFT_72851 [Melanogaster broomeanus]|nr:hypothetical protein BU15DRAFT_72851 [Melanogaster broomeanus]